MKICNWEKKLLRGESIIPPPIFEDSADYALSIFKSLRIPDIAGQPTFGEASLPWVFDLVRAIFGGYNAETGMQEIKEVFLMVAKKNTKSTLSAGIMLTALIISWRENEEHLILAPSKEVAGNSFEPAAAMVRVDPELSKRFIVRDHIKTIEDPRNKNSLKVVAADSSAVGGKKAGRILVDEIWLFGEQAKAKTMLMEATGGMASRPEGFVIYLTTQSDKRPAGVFKEKLEYARKVRDGEIQDDNFLPVLYEYTKKQIEEKAYLDPKFWNIPNPNLGASVSEEYLERELKKALESSDEEDSLQKFIAKYFNVEIGLDLASDRWAGASHWIGAEKGHSLDELIERSEVITIGIDGGGHDDLLGLYILGRTEYNEILGWGYAWAHESVGIRRKEILPNLQDFSALGELTFVKKQEEEDEKRELDDVRELGDLCARIKESGKLYKIGIDPAGVGAILTALQNRGFEEGEIIGISQGWRLGGTIKTVERWLMTKGAFSPAKQELMRWSVGNAKVEDRANSILITKQKSGSAKIDPLMALFNAGSLMALNPEPPVKEYEIYF